MNVKSHFSIKDLENLSSVKAHTIRIWEKRYGLLQPARTKTNIRTYDLQSLKKLLNISLLYKEGYKISKIAKLSDSEINQIIQVKEGLDLEHIAIYNLKKAMFEFDVTRFNKTYNDLLGEQSFSAIFINIFIPLLSDIGQLWQTNTIDPAHESFISELIKQKIMLNIDTAQQEFELQSDVLFSLFLPSNEIHEIGLLYAHYEIIKAGFQTIYLGANIPLQSLKFLLNKNKNLYFLSYLTMLPERKTVSEYIDDFQTHISNQKLSNLWLMGPKSTELSNKKPSENIQIITKISDLLNNLKIIKQS